MSTTSATSDLTSDATTNQSTQIPSLANLANLISIKLDGDNYLAWKHQIVTVLKKMMGLLSYLKKDISPPAKDSNDRANWEKADGYVSACLNATLSPSIAHIAIGTSSASELWSVIEETFFQQLFAKQMQLRTQFQVLKQNDLSITNYCDKAKHLADSLKAAGDSITDSSLVLQVLHGLNHDFTPIRLNIESGDALPTFHQVRSKLLTYEARLSQQETFNTPVSAMAAITMRPSHQSNPDRSVICQICDKTGHRANNCYQLQGNRGGGGGRWRGGNRSNRSRGGRNNNNYSSGGRTQFVGGANWSQNGSTGGGSWPIAPHSAHVAYGSNHGLGFGTSGMNGFSNWVGGVNGPRGSMGFQDPRNTNSSTLGQPTTPNQFNPNQNQGILGPRPNVSTDPSAFMGFGQTSSDSTGSIPSFDTPHFGQSHFNSWAADQTTQHYGFSATLSDLCQTVESWIPDSGATAHMTSDVSLVHGAVPYTGTENVIVGNDSNRADPPPHAA